MNDPASTCTQNSVKGLRIPRYRLHRASGQAVVTIRARDIYLGTFGSEQSRAEYDRIIAEYIAARGVPEDRRATLGINEFCLAYWRHAQAYYPSATANGTIKPVIRRFRKIYGSTRVADFGPLKLKAFRETLLRERDERGGDRDSGLGECVCGVNEADAFRLRRGLSLAVRRHDRANSTPSGHPMPSPPRGTIPSCPPPAVSSRTPPRPAAPLVSVSPSSTTNKPPASSPPPPVSWPDTTSPSTPTPAAPSVARTATPPPSRVPKKPPQTGASGSPSRNTPSTSSAAHAGRSAARPSTSASPPTLTPLARDPRGATSSSSTPPCSSSPSAQTPHPRSQNSPAPSAKTASSGGPPPPASG